MDPAQTADLVVQIIGLLIDAGWTPPHNQQGPGILGLAGQIALTDTPVRCSLDGVTSALPESNGRIDGPPPTGIVAEIKAWGCELARLERSAAYQHDGPKAMHEAAARFGWSRAADATALQLIEWIDARGGTGHTKNNNLAMASRFLEFCKRTLGTVKENAADAVTRSPRRKGNGPRPFKPEEAGRVIAAARGHWRTACIIMATTMLRRGAVFRGVRCGFLDRERRALEIPEGFLKNKKAQTIPLNDDAFAAIESAARGRSPTEPIVPIGFDGDTWLDILEAAGVPHKDERGRIAGTHSFRKGSASAMARAGVHPKVAQALLGHSDIRLTMDIYTELDGQEAAAAVRHLGLSTWNAGLSTDLSTGDRENPRDNWPGLATSAKIGARGDLGLTDGRVVSEDTTVTSATLQHEPPTPRGGDAQADVTLSRPHRAGSVARNPVGGQLVDPLFSSTNQPPNSPTRTRTQLESPNPVGKAAPNPVADVLDRTADLIASIARAARGGGA